ncbi:hypothetical protein ACTFIY_004599 [Dictyostelium cf. discoideum]
MLLFGRKYLLFISKEKNEILKTEVYLLCFYIHKDGSFHLYCNVSDKTLSIYYINSKVINSKSFGSTVAFSKRYTSQDNYMKSLIMKSIDKGTIHTEIREYHNTKYTIDKQLIYIKSITLNNGKEFINKVLNEFYKLFTGSITVHGAPRTPTSQREIALDTHNNIKNCANGYTQLQAIGEKPFYFF